VTGFTMQTESEFRIVLTETGTQLPNKEYPTCPSEPMPFVVEMEPAKKEPAERRKESGG
jgi:hypothetical protein